MKSRIRGAAFTGALAVAMVAGAASAAVTFTDLDLGTANGDSLAKSYSKNGVTLNVTTGNGSMTTIADGEFAGLWFSQDVIADGTYTLDFNGVGTTSVEIAMDAMSGVGDGRERLLDWATTGATPDISVSNTSNVDVSGSDLASLVIACTQDTDNGKFTLTLTSALPFTSVSFRHLQNPFQNGTVIERVTVDAVPAPASLALVGLSGLAATRRRR